MQPNLIQTPNLLTKPKQGSSAAPEVKATPAPDTGIDPTIKALASAIGEAETGPSSPDAYTKKGASGEYGRYQFMPSTYKNYAKKYLGDSNAAPTMENQNKIVYDFIKEKKAAGYNPAQIASMWNAGEGRPNAYKEGWKGVNSQGVAYDTPAYAEKVSQLYQAKKQQGGALGAAGIPSPELGGKDTFLGDVGQTLGKAGTRLSNALNPGNEMNPASRVIQSAGAVAGGIGDLTSNVLEHTPVVGSVFKGIEGLIGKGVGKLAETNTGQGLISNYQQFAQTHPEMAANLGSAFDVATAIPVLKGLGVAKSAAGKGINTALRGATDDVLDAVSPALGPKAQARAVMERGTVQKGLLRETQIAPDPNMEKVAEAVRQNVPKFDSNNMLKSVAETQKSVNTLKKSLKADVSIQGAGKIYPTKELMARLREIEMPDLIAADATLSNVYKKLITRVKSVAEKQGGKVENLPDILSDFDAIVKKQYPNLYRSEALTPLRQGVKDIREAIKTFAEEQMPNVALKERMLTVHRLLTAMENMSVKATKGTGKQIGTNALSRMGAKHPVIKGLVKSGTNALVQGSGIGAVMGLMK